MSTLFLKSLLGGGVTSLAILFSAASALAVDLGQAQQLADIAFGYAIANQPDKAIPLLEQAETYQGGDCFEGNAWLKISVGYDAVNQPDKAQIYLKQAIDTARAGTEENCASGATSPSESLLNRTIDYAESGNLDLAMELVQQVEAWSQPLAMAEIAAEYNQAGQPQQAQKLISDAIVSVQENDAALDVVYSNQILLATVGLLLLEDQTDLANWTIEESEIIKSLLEGSTDTLEDNADTHQRINLARLLMDLDQPQHALTVLDATVPTIQPSSQFPLDAFYGWIDAAQLYTELGSDQADAIWQQVERNLEQLSDSFTIASVQGRLVSAYAEIGEFEQARVLAETIDNTNERSTAYQAIAVAYAEAGLVKEANALIDSIDEPEFARRNILHTYLNTEQYAEAEQLAKQTVELLPEVIRTYCETGQPERAMLLFEQLNTDNDESKDWLRSCIATQWAEQQQFDSALELTQTIVEPDHKATTLTAIAVQQVNRTPRSLWGRFISRLPNPLQAWLTPADSHQNAIALLDQALDLVQTDS